MADPTDTRTTDTEHSTGEHEDRLPADPHERALLTVELELMRNPSIARLNGGRRRALAANVLRALDEQGLLAEPEQKAPLRLVA